MKRIKLYRKISFHERMEVYSALRDEAIRLQGEQSSFILAIYTIYAALLAVGMHRTPVLFATYMPILGFQSMINYKSWQIAKVSLYIRVFFENRRWDMHWSGLHAYDEYLHIHKKMTQSLEGILRNTGSIILSSLSTILVIYQRLSIYNLTDLTMVNRDYIANIMSAILHEAGYILPAIVLCGFCFYLNICFFTYGKKKRRAKSMCVRVLNGVIRRNKESICTTEGSKNVDNNSLEEELHNVIRGYYLKCNRECRQKMKSIYRDKDERCLQSWRGYTSYDYE